MGPESHLVKEAQSLTICSTGFTGEDRHRIQVCVQCLGASYSKELIRDETTHLVCRTILESFGTPKYVRALEWGIPIVTAPWLLDSIVAKKLQPVASYKTDKGPGVLNQDMWCMLPSHVVAAFANRSTPVHRTLQLLGAPEHAKPGDPPLQHRLRRHMTCHQPTNSAVAGEKMHKENSQPRLLHAADENTRTQSGLGLRGTSRKHCLSPPDIKLRAAASSCLEQSQDDIDVQAKNMHLSHQCRMQQPRMSCSTPLQRELCVSPLHTSPTRVTNLDFLASQPFMPHLPTLSTPDPTDAFDQAEQQQLQDADDAPVSPDGDQGASLNNFENPLGDEPTSPADNDEDNSDVIPSSPEENDVIPDSQALIEASTPNSHLLNLRRQLRDSFATQPPSTEQSTSQPLRESGQYSVQPASVSGSSMATPRSTAGWGRLSADVPPTVDVTRLADSDNSDGDDAGSVGDAGSPVLRLSQRRLSGSTSSQPPSPPPAASWDAAHQLAHEDRQDAEHSTSGADPYDWPAEDVHQQEERSPDPCSAGRQALAAVQHGDAAPSRSAAVQQKDVMPSGQYAPYENDENSHAAANSASSRGASASSGRFPSEGTSQYVSIRRPAKPTKTGVTSVTDDTSVCDGPLKARPRHSMAHLEAASKQRLPVPHASGANQRPVDVVKKEEDCSSGMTGVSAPGGWGSSRPRDDEDPFMDRVARPLPVPQANETVEKYLRRQLRNSCQHVPDPDHTDIAPVKLMTRPPRGNSVKEQHNLLTLKYVNFAEQLQILSCDLLLSSKEKAHCAVVRVGAGEAPPREAAVVGEPFAFYQLPSGEWWMEFYRFHTGRDATRLAEHLGLPLSLPVDFELGNELLRDTDRMHCRVSDIIADMRISRTKKVPTQRMRTADKYFFWRYVLDATSMHVLTDRPAADLVIQ